MKFDDLIREGRDTAAMRLMAREQYDKGRIGHTRMLLMVRVADELDEKTRELSFSRGKQQKQSVRDFLADIANNEILQGKKYSHRIEINDGGDNSYIGLNVDTNDFQRKTPVTQSVRLYRHTNSANKALNMWTFSLGSVCYEYADNPDIPLRFESYGKTPDEAEAEAEQYFNELKKLVRKQTSIYKTQAAKEVEKERNELIARLNELNGNMQPPVSDQ